MSQFTRRIDWDHPDAELPGGYKGQFLYYGEKAFISATLVPPGSNGPARHKHLSVQTYVVLKGEITIALGAEVHTAGAGSAIYIPAGVPHQNWNAGSEDEIHLEVIAPGILPIDPVAIPTNETDTNGLPYFVTPAGNSRTVPREGFAVDWLVDRQCGSEYVAVNIAEVPPGGAGPRPHIHTFDQYYLVLDGTLSVDVGLERIEATAGTLVVLPAGVPHRQWNEGDATERHVTIITPSPLHPHSADRPWDIDVEFRATGSADA